VKRRRAHLELHRGPVSAPVTDPVKAHGRVDPLISACDIIMQNVIYLQ